MLWYIIDGWNLVNKIKEVKLSPSPSEALITYIRVNKLTGSRNNKVSIVFDGRCSFTRVFSEFEIIYSEEKSADDVIKEMVSKAKQKKIIVVVSDDRSIVEAIKRAGANSLSTGDFLDKRKKKQSKSESIGKDISYSLQREITEELKKIWLKE